MKTWTKWNEEEINNLKLDYGNISKQDLCKKYNRTYNSIQSAAKNNYIKIIPKDFDKTKDVISLYESGFSTPKIKEILNVNQFVIDRILKQNLIEKRDNSESKKKYTVDKYYFDNINTENKAYFLGLMYADGWNDEKHTKIGIQLSEKDSGILEIFKKDINYSGPLLFQNKNLKNTNSVRLVIGDKYLSKSAANLGLVQNKTKILKNIPNIPSDLIRHFIRGYFDGDGSVIISKNKRGTKDTLTISIVGMEEFLNKLNIILSKITNKPNRNLVSVNHSIVKYLNFKGNISAKLIYDYFYKDATTYFPRKKNKFNLILNDKFYTRYS